LDFHVEESSLDVFNYLFEVLPIIETSCHSIVIERMAAFISPPLLGMFGKSQFLGIFRPSLVDNCPKLVDYAFQFFYVANVRYVQVLEV